MRPLVLLLLAAAGPAFADGDASWAAFRAEVAKACLTLVQDPGEKHIEVNPFGSPSYGVALVDLVAASGTDRMVCIYDKRSKTAELSAPFTPKP